MWVSHETKVWLMYKIYPVEDVCVMIFSSAFLILTTFIEFRGEMLNFLTISWTAAWIVNDVTYCYPFNHYGRFPAFLFPPRWFEFFTSTFGEIDFFIHWTNSWIKLRFRDKVNHSITYYKSATENEEIWILFHFFIFNGIINYWYFYCRNVKMK